MPRVGFEPTRPLGQRILSPPRLPFRHLGERSGLHLGAAGSRIARRKLRRETGGDGRIRTADRGFADPRLRPLGYVAPEARWCRGRDLNPHEQSPLPPQDSVSTVPPPRQRSGGLHSCPPFPLCRPTWGVSTKAMAGQFKGGAPDSARDPGLCLTFSGRSGRIRTPDRWFWRPVLYHLSYTPVKATVEKAPLWFPGWCPCPDSNRGTRFRKPLLYPPELQGPVVEIGGIEPPTSALRTPRSPN